MTLQQTDVTSPVYWRNPFDSLATVSDLVEFVVLDIEPSGAVRGRHVLADAQVTRTTTSSGTRGTDEEGMGDDGIYHTRTHLGAILQPGDIVLGYHLTNSNFNSEAFEALDQGRIPDVVLVKKTYPNRRRKARTRNWKLKSIAKEAEDVAEGGDKVVGRGALGRRGGVDQKNVERDYELFLRDLEEDKEMRAAINLYKTGGAAPEEDVEGDVKMNGNGGAAGSGMKGGKRRNGKKVEEEKMEVEGDLVQDEGHDGDDETVDDEDDDFPEIEMDELLEHFEEMGVDDGVEGGEEVN
jgi:nonsense-mediated mRNA decay protein 3